jgi:hypothetical protein
MMIQGLMAHRVDKEDMSRLIRELLLEIKADTGRTRIRVRHLSAQEEVVVELGP